MKRRIYGHFIIIALTIIAVLVVLLTGIFYNLSKNQVMDSLKVEANMISGSLITDNLNQNIQVLDRYQDIVRITLIDSDGTVLYDNEADVNTMENHLGRLEVMEAIAQGTGEAIRTSDTLNKDTFYYAVAFPNGYILRVARDAYNLRAFYQRTIVPILLTVAGILLLCLVLTVFMTRAILRPIEDYSKNLEKPDYRVAYKELVPFADTIRAQHAAILKSAKMRQDFTANVSHELKTPLTSISGYAEMMENGMASDQEILHFSKEIHKNATRLLTLINDIIKLSELDNIECVLSFEMVDVNAIAKRCIEDLSVNAKKNHVNFKYQGESCLIRANAEMITELIYNLCDNAIRYNKENGNVLLSIQQLEHNAQIRVADTGIGIADHHRDRIFERFYRVDKSRSTQTGGTGLGLAIVKHIVNLHEGKLTLESEERKGTTIVVTL